MAAIGQSGPRRVEAPSQDQLEPWADQIYQWITKDRLRMTRIHDLLVARGCTLSYQSLRRFVLKRNWRRPSKTTVRMADTPPGEVAEANFGRLGMITDPATGKRKAVCAMVIVLCHSRHCFVWPMQQHKLPNVITGLEAAWAFFGGMPKYLVIDNFPAAAAGSVSSRAPTSTTSLTSVPRRQYGAWRWPERLSMAPRGRNPRWSSRMRSVIPCSPGTASPTKSPNGAPTSSTGIFTSTVWVRSTPCLPTSARRDRRWRYGWTANWYASTTALG